jgi:phosphatidylinositol alpha-mannosyltransferase
MKIGLVCPYNITRGGGVREIVMSTQRELLARGHDVKVITPLPRNNEPISLPNVIFVGGSSDFRSPTHTKTQVSATADFENIEAVMDAEQFDILHFHEPWVPVLSRQILQRSKAVNIATFHAVVPETLMSRTVIRVVNPYMKSVLKYLHELTAVSDAAAEYVTSMTDEPITIIPNGIDLDLYKKNTAKPTHKSVLYIGRLERRKGVKYLLQAFQLLLQNDPEASLIIAGDGPDREKLELLAEDLKLTNVTFLGYISDELKLELLSEATIFCSPAVYGESFGIVLLEAMAKNVVTIAGNNSGYSGLMQGLGAVSIVNPRDSLEFARRLELLMNEQPLRKLWLNWASDFVQQFAWPKVTDQYEELYREALKTHGRR